VQSSIWFDTPTLLEIIWKVVPEEIPTTEVGVFVPVAEVLVNFNKTF
jgi:hypothetical protein